MAADKLGMDRLISSWGLLWTRVPYESNILREDSKPRLPQIEHCLLHLLLYRVSLLRDKGSGIPDRGPEFPSMVLSDSPCYRRFWKFITASPVMFVKITTFASKLHCGIVVYSYNYRYIWFIVK